jgi:hypothetical protein
MEKQQTDQVDELGQTGKRSDSRKEPHMSRPRLRPDGIPSRCDISLMTAAELAITEAMGAVELAGASMALTDSVSLLSKARDRVADHVEGVNN